MQWKTAALTFLTLPLAIWVSTSINGGSHALAAFVGIGCLPLAIGVVFDIRERRRQIRQDPNSYQEGSPIGNKIALVLGLVLLALACMAMVRIVARGA
jgi:hypothetical protein